MRFVETPVFTRQIADVLDEEEYRRLQLALLFRPEQGALIPRSGGLRKIRWKRTGGGRRGGLRVIYYLEPTAELVYMLFGYPKSTQDDLTSSQLRILRQLVREELNMKNEDFEEMLKSVKQAGKIKRGKIETVAFVRGQALGHQVGAREAEGLSVGVRSHDRCQRRHATELGARTSAPGGACPCSPESRLGEPQGGCRRADVIDETIG